MDNKQANIPKIKGRYISLDLETTGRGESDHVIALSSFEIEDGNLNSNDFTFYILERVNIKKEALKINHLGKNYSRYQIKDKNEEKEIFLKYLFWVGNSLIFSHNSDFDSKFLNKELAYLGIPIMEKSQIRCTKKLFKQIVTLKDEGYVESRLRLIDCCNYFNLIEYSPKFHNVVYDAKLTGLLLVNLLKLNENEKIENLRLSNMQIKKCLNEEKEDDKNNKSLVDKLFKELDI